MNRKAIPLLSAVAIGGLTLIAVTKAYAVTTVANALKITISVPAGGASGFYPWPHSANAPFLLMAANLTGGYRGTGHITGTYQPPTSTSISSFTWSGVNAATSAGSTPTGGYVTSATATPANVVAVGWNNSMILQVVDNPSGDPAGFRITNTTPNNNVVSVLFVY